MVLPPPGGSNTGCGDCEGEDIGPQETEYGRAIRCDETDYGPLRGLGATGGGHGSPNVGGSRRESTVNWLERGRKTRRRRGRQQTE